MAVSSSDSGPKRNRDESSTSERDNDSGPRTKTAKKSLPSTPDHYPTSQSYDTIVGIKTGTGDKEKTFDIHRGLLCFYSGYFRTAFNGRWREAQDGAIDMSSQDSETFQRFVHWVYSRRLDLPSNPTGTALESWTAMSMLWIFADAHEVPLLQNEVISHMHNEMHSKWIAPSHLIIPTYENTMPGSPLRRLLIDCRAYTGDHMSLKENPERYCREALLDLIDIVWRDDYEEQKEEEFAKWDVCSKYHVHEKDVKCKKNA